VTSNAFKTLINFAED